MDASNVMMTSKVECLNPAATDSSLIFPATKPIMKTWTITEIVKVIEREAKSIVPAPFCARLTVLPTNKRVKSVVAINIIAAK